MNLDPTLLNTPETLRSFGHQIRTARQIKGWLLKDRHKHGFDWRELKDIETGRRPMSVEVLNRLAEKFKF